MNESLRYLGTGTAAPVRAHPAFAATRAEPDMGETVISPHGVAAAGPARGLRGRHAECVALDRLVAEVRAGQSRVLILRGESGAGKTALLEHLLDGAAGFRIARAAGAESEMELAFAGLHQLCAPFLDQVEALPGPQREALEVAFGLRDGDRPDRFLAGLAALGLLSKVAENRPLVCAVDDAQWLDQASSRVLAFVARHLAGGPVALVLAMRPDGMGHDLAGLAELPVGGLADGDAGALLDSALPGRLDERVRDRIVAEARGIPGVLLELAGRLGHEELAGGFGLPGAMPADRAEEGFRERLGPLPEATRLLLLVAAAEPTSDPMLVWRAAGLLGVGADAARPAAEAGLIAPGGQVRFGSPLVRSAVYRAASPKERQGAHRALAEATDPGTDPDRRAWHRAHAATGLDEDIAAELERAAPTARVRGGLAAAAAFCERAAELTRAPDKRARRALAAAQLKYQAGAAEGARRLVALAQAGPLDEVGRAQAQLLHAQLAGHVGRGREALLVKAARQLEPLDPGLARQGYLDAFYAALTAGRLETGELLETAEAARATRLQSRPPRSCDLLLDGLALLTTEGYATGAPLLRQALAELRDEDVSVDDGLGWLLLACRICRDVWDDRSWSLLSARLIELARRDGALGVLPAALASGMMVQVLSGEPALAAVLAQQAEAAARAAGHLPAPYGALLAAAWDGRDGEVAELIAAATTEMTAQGDGQWLTAAAWASAVLYNGLSRYDEALAAAEEAGAHPGELGLATWSLAELIEAAARTGQPGRAAEALVRLCAATDAAGTDWALGIQARCRALLSESAAAEHWYREAIDRLARTQVRVELARTYLVYGEWLRRESRRVDAREQLRAAHNLLTEIGMEGFAERARRELVATGETVRRRTVEAAVELTPQEAQIARLAGDGHTNPEISSQMYLSPRTVEWHLRKVFAKLGISSRKELRRVLPELCPTALSA
jgi:DNA-binding CsgD family transcriptional regulator